MRHIEYACSLVEPGLNHALEFGVFRGDSIRLMREYLPPEVEVYGFDSFRGLPFDWRDANGELVGGCERGFFSTNGIVPDVRDVTFFKGWFHETIPRYLELAEPIGLLHVDCDLYLSTCDVLYGLDHFMVPGTIVVFDEWIYNHDLRYDDHEQLAFRDWIDLYDRKFELVPFDGDSDEQQIVRILG